MQLLEILCFVLVFDIVKLKQVRIEDVTAKQLEAAVELEENLAVIWYGKNCKTCDRVLSLLEDKIGQHTEKAGITLLSINDKKLAKNYNIRNFPTITIIRSGDQMVYDGDMMDSGSILDFILSVHESENNEIPHVTVDKLDETVATNKYVAVFFYDEEEISDLDYFTSDVLHQTLKRENITAVKITDNYEARMYGVTELPSIMMFVNKVHKKYTGEMELEKIVDWTLVQSGSIKPIEKSSFFPAAFGLENEKELKFSSMVEETGQDNFDEIEEKLLKIKNENNVVGFFYETQDKISNKIIFCLEKIERSYTTEDLKFIRVNAKDVKDINLKNVPTLIYFKNGIASHYEGNLLNEEAIKSWIEEEYRLNQNVIEDLSLSQIQESMNDSSFLLVFVYTENDLNCEDALKQMEQIDDDTEAVGVKFVKTKDEVFVEKFGIDSFPSIIYFEESQPSIYEGDASEETELLTWVLYQMKEDTIENINRELFTNMIDEVEFLAVFFYDENEQSKKSLRHIELIDGDAAEYGVRFVKLKDVLISKKYGHRQHPGLGFFRKGNYIKFEGDMLDEEEILDWLTDPNTMEISDQIEKVNKKMFEKLIARNENLVVFFYSDTDCKQCDSVLKQLETIDDDAETAGVPIVKLEDIQLAKTVGVFTLPSIVFFRNFGEEKVIFAGDIRKEENILDWMLVQKDPNSKIMEEKEGDELYNLLDKSDALAILLLKEDCNECRSIVSEIENIDDEVKRQQIHLIKTTDLSFAEKVGVKEFPVLLFYKNQVPNLYEGDVKSGEEILDWLVEIKIESHIELITRPMLEVMVTKTQYIAVLFYKQNCRTCDHIINQLEKIDDECDDFGIQLVKLKDPQFAKRYGIRTFPALVYFRNGNPITFEGELKVGSSVLEWLTDDENRELEDEIEEVNNRMLDKLLESSPLIAVFFYDEECVDCDIIMEHLEDIDDEVDEYGIDFVKNDDPNTARQYNIYNTPALVYFRKMSPVVYDGDLLDANKILDWLTSQDVFEIKNEIEDVNRKLLEKLLEENDFLVVYFEDESCSECDEILRGLESIDDEVDALDITFVKVNDQRYAKKYGITKLPGLVYFRRKFPSIYRDSLVDEKAVLSWISSNRYRQLELGVFMYAMISLVMMFIGYTGFLMFGLHLTEVEKKKDD